MVMVSRADRANRASLEKQGSAILTGLRLRQRIDSGFHPGTVPVIGRFGHEHPWRNPWNYRSFPHVKGSGNPSGNRSERVSGCVSVNLRTEEPFPVREELGGNSEKWSSRDAEEDGTSSRRTTCEAKRSKAFRSPPNSLQIDRPQTRACGRNSCLWDSASK